MKSYLVSGASVEMRSELGLLQLLSTVLALKPHHCLFPSLSISLCGSEIVLAKRRALLGFWVFGFGRKEMSLWRFSKVILSYQSV